MSYILEFLLESSDSDDVVGFELGPDEMPGGLALSSDEHGPVTERASASLERVIDRIVPALQRIHKVVAKAAPDTAEVEVGVKLGGETGVIFTKGTSEAHIVIRMSWVKAS
jgi:Trypsin-co-occurring domain 1